MTPESTVDEPVNAGATAPAGLLPALLDFEQRPGRYRLAMREPKVLYEHTHAVLLLAAGRSVEGLAPLESAQTDAAQQAARYFVRSVMLRPGADHYTLLGLAPDFSPTVLRDHYRLMIRLTHPDMAASGEAWPADAASRINLANDALGSPVRRSAYDTAQEAAKSAPRPNAIAVGFESASRPGDLAPHGASSAPSSPHGLRGVLGSVGWDARKVVLLGAGVVLGGGLLVWLAAPTPQDGVLVAQRAGPTSPTDSPLASLRGPTASVIAQNPKATEVAERLALTESTAAAEAAAAEPPAGRVNKAVAAGKSDAAAASKKPSAAPAAQVDTSKADTSKAQPAVATKLSGTQATAPAVTGMGPMPTELPVSKQKTGAASDPAAGEGQASASVSYSGLARSLLKRDLLPKADDIAPTATARPESAAVTLQQLQPTLDQVLVGLESGQGANVVRLLEGHWRDHPAADVFIQRYQQLLAGQRVTGLGHVAMNVRSAAEHVVVDGVIQLKLQSGNESVQSKELSITAYFLPQGDQQPVLVQVVAHQLR